ncbi:MAG: TrmH family RNA methyltransferase [bacterium]|jgi:TrmH family RNA methyltransferase
MSEQFVKQIKELSTLSGREQQKKCILEGQEIIEKAIDANFMIDHVFVESKKGEHPFILSLRERGVECIEVSADSIKEMHSGSNPVPFLGVATPPEVEIANNDNKDFVIVFDQVQEPEHVGVVVKTVKAFGIQDIISTTMGFDLHSQRAIKASNGTVFDTQLERFHSSVETIATLKEKGYQVIATSPHVPELQSSLQLNSKPIALIIGNEMDGIAEEILRDADLVVQIPRSAKLETLNLNTPERMNVYEFKLKLFLTMLFRYMRSTLGREASKTGKHVQSLLDYKLKQVSAYDSNQVILMMTLQCEGIMTLEQIGKSITIFGNTLLELIYPLLDEGLIEYQEHAGMSYLLLSDTGNIMLEKLWQITETTEEKILDGFSNQERKQLSLYLQRIQGNCKKFKFN